MDLKEKVRSLPSSPGVYLMKDSHDGIIYVGKSKNLKQRVQSYFQHSKAHSRKVEKLVKNIKDFDFILTDTEFEAFMLECQLIKELKPFYNKLMKNPLSYTYIAIQTNEKNRRIEITNSPIKKDDHLYFGPFTSKSTVEKAIQGLKECFKINCSNPSKKNTPCLNYTLGLCIGVCLGGSAVEQYNRIIDQIIDLFKGSDMSLLEKMQERMVQASEQFDFETATKYRDWIHAIHALLNKEKVIAFTEANKNIVTLEYLNEGSFKLFFIKGRKVLYREKYFLKNQGIEQLSQTIKETILTYFQTKTPHPTKGLNRDEVDEAQIIYSYLKSNNCCYRILPENLADIDEEINKLISNN